MAIDSAYILIKTINLIYYVLNRKLELLLGDMSGIGCGDWKIETEKDSITNHYKQSINR